MEYYPVVKKNKAHSSATWMKLEIIAFSEVSIAQKDKYYMISTVCCIELKDKMMVIRN